ncbi:MAG: phosphate ABC transporter permease subunit PstC [Proteobacteria bacterium]|nr:phosphate ABC transporter permease subunit PstC [Pseudomonadota bacterium]
MNVKAISLALPCASVPYRSATSTSHRDTRNDRLFRGLMFGCAALVLLALAGAAGATLWGGRQALSTFGWHFFTSTTWDVNNGQFGALFPIIGTLATALIAIVIAVPVSFGIALFLTDVAPQWMRGPIGAAIELLAGIPSIIYGMWGFFVFVPIMSGKIEPFLINHLGDGIDAAGKATGLGLSLFSGAPVGVGLLTAGIVLAVMIVPFIASVMREVFLTVPSRLKESACALGSTRWEVLWNIVLPYTRTAVIGGIFLGLGRALGETMAVTFVIGNSHDPGASIVMPGTSIAATIANEFNEASGDLHRSALIALAFVLFGVTFIVLAVAKLMLRRLARREGAR